MKPRSWNSTLPAPTKPLTRRASLSPGKTPERRTRMPKRNAKRAAKRYARDFGAHAETIRALPCCACGAPGPSDPHHVVSRGAGGTAQHQVPLCRNCHRLLHQIGRRTFEALRKVSLVVIAAELWERYGGGEG